MRYKRIKLIVILYIINLLNLVELYNGNIIIQLLKRTGCEKHNETEKNPVDILTGMKHEHSRILLGFIMKALGLDFMPKELEKKIFFGVKIYCVGRKCLIHFIKDI